MSQNSNTNPSSSYTVESFIPGTKQGMPSLEIQQSQLSEKISLITMTIHSLVSKQDGEVFLKHLKLLPDNDPAMQFVFDISHADVGYPNVDTYQLLAELGRIATGKDIYLAKGTEKPLPYLARFFVGFYNLFRKFEVIIVDTHEEAIKLIQK